jgi:hypothetical protein
MRNNFFVLALPYFLHIEICRCVEISSCLIMYSPLFCAKVGHPRIKWSVVSSIPYTIGIYPEIIISKFVA